MTTDTIRILVAGGIFMMLLLLRLEANRFGAAEFDEPGGRRRGFRTRLSWYLIGFGLLAAIYVVHPAPHDVLVLLAGHRADVINYGTVLVLLGLGQAPVLAWWRYGYLRLPPARAYPGAAVNSIATAVIDEATFRGALLGTLLSLGLLGGWAIVVTTIVYVLMTRMAAPGRPRSMSLLACGIGLACGWATLESGGLGAAIIGHAVASFALFVCTGHAGQVPAAGSEPEEMEYRKRPPKGWQDARLLPRAGGAAEMRGLPEQIGPSGFGSRVGLRGVPARRSGGLRAWLRSVGEVFVDEPAPRPHRYEPGADHVYGRRPR
jgi:Type II CAAX prenyl endopeptidase Rce1-like